MANATLTTIKISQPAFKKGVVVLSLAEYRELQARAVPTYYLTGKKALALDRLVEEGLAEHRAGKTIMASSLREASEMYERRLKHGRKKKGN